MSTVLRLSKSQEPHTFLNVAFRQIVVTSALVILAARRDSKAKSKRVLVRQFFGMSNDGAALFRKYIFQVRSSTTS